MNFLSSYVSYIVRSRVHLAYLSRLILRFVPALSLSLSLSLSLKPTDKLYV